MERHQAALRAARPLLSAPRARHDRRALNVRALLESTGIPFTVADYPQRAVIFRQGDSSDSVIHIERGRVLLAVSARSGKEAICGLLGSGAFLGEEALAGHSVRLRTAIAMTATKVLVIAKAQMLRLIRAQPAIADRFLVHLLARNSRLEADLTDQLLNSAEQRLARTLLVLANCDEQCRSALPDVSQEIIAAMVGTTRARVNALMGKFKKLGFIEEDGGVLRVHPSRRHLVHDGCRGIVSGASAAMPQTFTAGGSAGF